MKRGLFVVLEGIDGSGTTTQTTLLHEALKERNKYLDVLTTHEPWRSDEIKRLLKHDKDAYSNAERMAELYVEDRKQHQNRLILPALNQGVVIISDRHALSTYAYQGTQGVDPSVLRDLHLNAGIIDPDITFLLDVNYETARERISLRGESLEKFERDEDFIRSLISSYREFSQGSFEGVGPVSVVNGEADMDTVSADVFRSFSPLYRGLIE